MFMTTSCQFRAGKWTKKPSNLSSGAIDAEKLAKIMLNSDDGHPIDSRCVLCFDEHGHSHNLASDVSYSRRPIVEMSLNSTPPCRSLKNHSSNWVEAKISDNEFKLVTCKEQDFFLCSWHERGKVHVISRSN